MIYPILRIDGYFPTLGKQKAMFTEEMTQEQAAEAPEKIYDMDKGEYVDNPAKKKEESKSDAEGEEEEEEEETPKAKKKESEKKDSEGEEEDEIEEEESGEEEESDESEEEEEEEEEEEDDSDKKKSKEDDAVTPDDYVTATFGEKFGIKTEKDLFTTIEKAVDVMDELTAVKKELGTLKAESGKPKFANKAQESAFDFVSKFDPSMQGEALQTFAKLVSIDLDKADPKMLLEEKFIHEHPEWTRAQASRMFEKEYTKKYTLNKEKWEGTEAEYEEEVKDMDIMKAGEVARARTFLKDLKEKHKPAEAEQPKANEAVTKSIEKNVKDYTSHVDKTNEIVFEDAGKKYTFKLDADKKKQVSEIMASWVKNPTSYNEKGELVGAGTPDEMLNAAIGGLFLKDIVKAVTSQVKNVVSKKRVEEIAERKPEKRKSQGGGERAAADDLDAQALRLIKKKANQG